jgi:hypothetical protein
MNLLKNMQLIQWCYEPLFHPSSIDKHNKETLSKSKQKEDEWANSIIEGKGGQLTTILCQNLVQEALIELGRKNVRKTKKMKSTLRSKKYDPDLECDEFVYEVKARNWSTTGTAGEKILGVPLKYGELPKLYHKPLRIVLVGYQEHEARHGYAFGDLLDANNQTKELKESLAYFKEHNIEYLGFTDILKAITLPQGCWLNIDN